MTRNSQDRLANSGILIVDYGSQYTLLIVRRLREIGVYAEVISPFSGGVPAGFDCVGLILSGGPDSVDEPGARQIPDWVWSLGRPILGVCYGMQLLARKYGAKVRSAKAREFGEAKVAWKRELSSATARELTCDLPDQRIAWMSHGDDVEAEGSDFEVMALSDEGVLAGISHKREAVFGVQFHPEVAHTEFGAELLANFAFRICKAQKGWDSRTIIEQIGEQVRSAIGAKDKILVAVSGGVDSSVTAVLLEHILGPERVVPVFVDTGLLRKDEGEWVKVELGRAGLKNLVILDAKTAFYQALAGVSDPEEKRRIIGHQFIREFERYAEGRDFTHLGQGTLYPDVIESAGHGHGAKVIKSHHNVGGLPENLKLKLIEPFRYLFKDEVRRVGRELAISEELLTRHPFPGPGLAVRILGEVTEARVQLLQEADDIFIRALREAGRYHDIWQAFVVLLPVQSVGVMGDNRTYENVVALRAVTGSDAMTADVSDMPIAFLSKVANRIVRQVRGINRVAYDVTSKPPATIEWE